MALGVGSSLFARTKVLVEGIKELDVLEEKFEAAGRQATRAGNRMDEAFTRAGGVLSTAGDEADESREQFGKMFGIGMNVMFLGMALNMVFGRMAKQMLKLTGTSQVFGAALKSVLLPFFLAISPILNKIALTMMDLPESIKTVAGALVFLLAVLGPIVFFGAQLFLLTTQLSIGFGTLLSIIGSLVLAFGVLGLSVMFIMRAFKGVEPVVNSLAAIVGGTLLSVLSPVLGAATALAGVFAGLTGIFKKFGDIVGTIASVIVAIIGGILIALNALWIGAGLIIVGILAIIWNFKEEIASAIGAVIDWILSIPKKLSEMASKAKRTILKFAGNFAGWIGGLVDDSIEKLKEIVNWFGNLGSKISSAVGNAASWLVNIGENMIEGLITGIKNMGSMITDAIAGLLPEKFKKALNAAADFGGKALNAVTDVLTPNDFILTSGGKMIQPDQNDTIVGFNGNGPIQPGGGGGETNITVNDPIVREEQDISRIVDEVEKRIDRNTRGRSGGLQ